MKIVISYWQDSFYCKNYLLKKLSLKFFKKIVVPIIIIIIIIIIVIIIIIYWPIQHGTPPQKLNLWTFNNLIYSYL